MFHPVTAQTDEYPWLADILQDESLPGTVYGDDSVVWGTSLGPYLNSTELKERLDLMTSTFPQLVSPFVLGESYEGKTIHGIVLTAPQQTSLEKKYDSILVGAHHAREAITVIDIVLFAERVIKAYLEGDSWAVDLLTTVNLHIVPMLNPDGVDFLHQFPWQRKNMQLFDGDFDGFLSDNFEAQDVDGDGYVHMILSDAGGFDGYEGIDGDDNDTRTGEDLPGGIDLNRNYAYEFVGDGSSTSPNSYTYRGPEPFSAPETLAFSEYALANHFTMSMSLHSGIEAIIAPWGYTPFAAPDAQLFDRIMTELQMRAYYPSWAEVGGYGVNGEWGDWMYGELGSIAMTIETYGADTLQVTNNRYYGIWDAFNPAANNIYDQTMFGVQKHLDYYFTVPQQDYFPQYVDVGNVAFDRHDGQLAYEIEILSVEEGVDLQVEIYNPETYLWESIHTNDYLALSDVHYEIIDVADTVADEHIRTYIGDSSKGWSYYTDFSDGPVGEGLFGDLLLRTSSTPASETSDTEPSGATLSTVIMFSSALVVLVIRNRR